MSVCARIVSQTYRVNVGLPVGIASCRCFHAEIVRDDSNGLPIVHHEKYVCDLPPNHRFPMGKFPRVLHFLLQDQVITEQQVWIPEIASIDLLSCVHTEDYLNNFISGRINEEEQRRTGFPWSEGIVRRCRYETGGTVLAAQVALQRGLACSTAGGTHHAFPSYGSGFCLLNDLAVTAKYLTSNSTTKRKILIVDLDVHQGDGTAFIFKEEPSVFTFSMHCGKNFPLRKQQSDLDVSVEDGLEDKEYLSTVEAHLPWLLDTFRPDLVLYNAGVDPHWEDELGRLCLTDHGSMWDHECPWAGYAPGFLETVSQSAFKKYRKSTDVACAIPADSIEKNCSCRKLTDSPQYLKGLQKRDLYVLKAAVSRGIPVATVIGGGYSRDVDKLALRHSIVHRAATQVWREM